MPYDLITYRFGALAELTPEAVRDFQLPPRKELIELFRSQRAEILRDNSFKGARDLIEAAAIGVDRAAVYAPGKNVRAVDPDDDSGAFDVITLPPSLGTPRKRRPGDPMHLVGLLPNDHLAIRIAGTAFAVRIRATVTACAMEVTNGFPKMWWTFEGVPDMPELGQRLSEADAVEFLKFAGKLEKDLLNHLDAAYFNALSAVTTKEPIGHKLGDERLRVRFADDNDEPTSALIDALRFRELTPSALVASDGDTLKKAKKGWAAFQRFVVNTNAEVEPKIDPTKAYPEVGLLGVEAVAACNDSAATHAVSIAGIAQRPGSRSSYAHLGPIQKRRLAQRDEGRVRADSPARQLSAQLASLAALTLDDRKYERAKHLAPALS